MLNSFIVFSTILYMYLKNINQNQIISMPSFTKYCGYKPNINNFINITKNMKLCIDGYYPHTIIISKNRDPELKDYFLFDVICIKDSNYIPEYIYRS